MQGAMDPQPSLQAPECEQSEVQLELQEQDTPTATVVTAPTETTISSAPPSTTPSQAETAVATVAAHSGDAGAVRKVVADEKFLPTLCLVSFFAQMGVVIRLYLVQLETFPSTPVFALIYPQLLGTFILGYLAKIKTSVQLVYAPLYVALSSGLCGSITTFSSWNVLAATAVLNWTGSYDMEFSAFLAYISILLVDIGMPYAAFKTGQHVPDVAEWQSIAQECMSWLQSKDPRDIIKSHRHQGLSVTDTNRLIVSAVETPLSFRNLSFFDIISVGIFILSTIGLIITCVLASSTRRVIIAMLIGPIGAVLRWRLSRLNPRFPRFPLGTFLANMIGTAVLGAMQILRVSIPLNTVPCYFVLAVSDGFCGCLTTISTFIIELIVLPRGASYIYGLSSVSLAQALLLVMLGARKGVQPWTSSGC